MIAPDETTFAYLEGKPRAPQGRDFAEAVERWRELPSDEGAPFDRRVEIDASALAPYVTWGTNPGMTTQVTGNVPDPDSLPSEAERKAARAALDYMGLEGGEPSKRSPSTGPSSAPAPTAASKTCGPPPRWRGDAASRRRCAPWSCPARRW